MLPFMRSLKAYLLWPLLLVVNNLNWSFIYAIIIVILLINKFLIESFEITA